MSPEEIKEIVRRFLDEPWNKRNLDAIDELCAADYILHGIGGREAYKKVIAGALASSSDLHATLDDIVVEGDKAAFRWTMQGTMQGQTRITKGITMLRFTDGKIAEDHGCSNSRPAAAP